MDNAVTGAAEYSVRVGFWTNISRGPIFGATLTLSRQHGLLVTAFTAFFVTIVAGRFWRIASLVFHRSYSSSEPQDTLYHQRQVIFRNSASSASGLWSLLQLCYAWHAHSGYRYLLRTLPPIIFALICVFGFAVASGFSSTISTTTGSEVLLNGGSCGFPRMPYPSEPYQNYINFIQPWAATKIANAANYAQQCYLINNTGILDCSIFVQKSLKTSSNMRSGCPFQGMCLNDSTTLFLDSGLVNSNTHLGINLPRELQFEFRHTLHCAPLKTEEYSNTFEIDSKNYTSYNYGSASAPNGSYVNFTYLVQSVEEQYRDSPGPRLNSQYLLGKAFAVTTDGTVDPAYSTFLPIPELQRSDADIQLIFLSGNGVASTGAIHDPWYQLVAPLSKPIESTAQTLPGQVTPYRAKEAASTLGCATQTQFCTTNSTCGPLAGFNDALNGAAPLFNIYKNISQYDLKPLYGDYPMDELASMLLWTIGPLAIYPLSIDTIVDTLGSQALLAQKRLMNGMQGPLPEDQWQYDVMYWWNTSLALLQSAFVDTAAGTNQPQYAQFMTNATNTVQEKKINSTQYTSFSIFGLYFTYITGAIIIVLSYILEPILSCLQRRRNYKEYVNLEWIANETLQLHRLGQEATGWGTWQYCTGSIPVTRAEDKLGPLNISDLEHPILHRPDAEHTEDKAVGSPYESADSVPHPVIETGNNLLSSSLHSSEATTTGNFRSEAVESTEQAIADTNIRIYDRYQGSEVGLSSSTNNETSPTQTIQTSTITPFH